MWILILVAGMLGDALGGRAVDIEIVDPNPEIFQERLIRRGMPAAGVFAGRGDASTLVEDFASAYRDAASRELLRTFRTEQIVDLHALPLLVAWSQAWAGVVTSMEQNKDGDIILSAEGPTAGSTSTAPREGKAHAVCLGDLRDVESVNGRLVARTTSGQEHVLVAAGTVTREVGHAGHWQALVPAGWDPNRPSNCDGLPREQTTA